MLLLDDSVKKDIVADVVRKYLSDNYDRFDKSEILTNDTRLKVKLKCFCNQHKTRKGNALTITFWFLFKDCRPSTDLFNYVEETVEDGLDRLLEYVDKATACVYCDDESTYTLTRELLSNSSIGKTSSEEL